jgi:hypothetical protein
MYIWSHVSFWEINCCADMAITYEMNMKELRTEHTDADRLMTERQNVHCLPRLFYTFGLLDRTANAKAEESRNSK